MSDDLRTVAYQGDPGAFSHEACLKYVAGHKPVAKADFAAVVAAVEKGEASLGVLPAVNSCAGAVPDVQPLLVGRHVKVIAAHAMPVRMHLLASPGAALDSIRTVVSHPMALAQCARTLRSLGLATEAAINTATAARILAATPDRSTAVLASEAAASTYGLRILRRDVHDQADNSTTFYVLARSEAAS